METEYLYHQLRKEGRSAGLAQWVIGDYYYSGRNLGQDLEKAEEWFLKAWDNRFPGTAKTQAFILKRLWDKYIAETYSENSRMFAVLSVAKSSSDERHGTILIPVHNDAQKEWIDTRIEEMKAAFQQFTNGRFLSVTISTEVQ